MPDWKPEIKQRLVGLNLEPTREAAIVEELAQHLEDSYRELLAGGATSTDAERRTLAELSESELLARELRRVAFQVRPEPVVLGTQGRQNIMADLWQDLRYGARTLLKNSSFTAIAVLTLALGIGINAAIFSVVDGVLLRPLPYQNADRLVRIWSADPLSGQRYLESRYQDFRQFKEESRAFVAIAAFSEAPRILRDEQDEPRHVTVARVTDSLFSVLGISPVVGRDFLPQEYEHGARSVIISYRLWQNRYSAGTDVLGRSVMIDGAPHTVVGVMPQGYSYPRTADMWRPLTQEETEDDDPEYSIIARLAPGATRAQADVEVSAIAQRIGPAADSSEKEDRRTAWVQTMQAMVVREVRTPLLVLLSAVALLLLIACVNVAHLLLARGLAREQEIAIRTALGARRGVMSCAVTERKKEIGIRRALGAQESEIVWAILRQGMALTSLGLVIGLVLAAWTTGLMGALLFNISATDPLTFGGVAALLFVVASLACYVPARRATKVDPLVALRYE